MTDTSERDRLARTIAMACGDDWDGREHPDDLGAYLDAADVLIANGWSRTVQRPEVDAEVEWGVRLSSGYVEHCGPRHAAIEMIEGWRIKDFDEPPRLVQRNMGPWQEAQ